MKKIGVVLSGCGLQDGSEIHEGASIRVIVTDIGDANGANQESNEDASASNFTLAAHTISKSLNDGYENNIFHEIYYNNTDLDGLIGTTFYKMKHYFSFLYPLLTLKIDRLIYMSF